jgi:hypothetical protein
VWELRYGSERGLYPTKGGSGFRIVAGLVERPRKFLKLVDLVGTKRGKLRVQRDEPGDEEADPAGATDDGLRVQGDSRDTIMDATTITEIRAKITQLKQDMEEEDDPLVQEENQKEMAELVAQLKGAIGPGGRRRKLGTNPTSRGWDAARKAWKRLLVQLADKDMPQLSAHLASHTFLNCPFILYDPPNQNLPS